MLTWMVSTQKFKNKNLNIYLKNAQKLKKIFCKSSQNKLLKNHLNQKGRTPGINFKWNDYIFLQMQQYGELLVTSTSPTWRAILVSCSFDVLAVRLSTTTVWLIGPAGAAVTLILEVL